MTEVTPKDFKTGNVTKVWLCGQLVEVISYIEAPEWENGYMISGPEFMIKEIRGHTLEIWEVVDALVAGESALYQVIEQAYIDSSFDQLDTHQHLNCTDPQCFLDTYDEFHQ
jgi:hypothetical protein